jgi:predicted HTH domain antitoxin
MPSVTIALPDTVAEQEAKLFLALKLFELGRLSCGKAAEVAGCSKRAFLEQLGKHGIPVFNTSPEELDEDEKNAGRRE